MSACWLCRRAALCLPVRSRRVSWLRRKGQMQQAWPPILFVKVKFQKGNDEGPSMSAPLPNVIAALFCEKVLNEADGSLSVVRIADRITYQIAPNLPPEFKPAVMLQGLICLRSGEAKGNFRLWVRGNSPSGKQQELFSLPIELKGGDHGVNAIVAATIGVHEDGLYWFDVILDDHTLTRIPLMVVQGEQKAPATK